MSQLVSVSEAVEALSAFLGQSHEEQPDEPTVESLFFPLKDKKKVSVEVEVVFMVSPSVHRVPLYFSVPHDFMTGSICLITPPPQRAFKDKLQVLVENGHSVAERVARVMDTKKLNEKITTPVSSRAFATSYSNFVLYGIHKYPKQLCGEFFAHRKSPIWVAKKHKLAEALDSASRTVVVPRRGQNAVTCKVGHTGLTTNQIVENIQSCIDQLTKHSQGSPFSHILRISVAGTSAKDKRISLPIYSHKFNIEQSSSDKEQPPLKKVRTE